MPAQIGPILMLWSALLLQGSGAGSGPIPTPRQDDAVASAILPIETVEAMPPGGEWPWRISEADTTEDDTFEGDDLGPSDDGPARRRRPGDRGSPSPIRKDRGSFRLPFRSPILRC